MDLKRHGIDKKASPIVLFSLPCPFQPRLLVPKSLGQLLGLFFGKGAALRVLDETRQSVCGA